LGADATGCVARGPARSWLNLACSPRRCSTATLRFRAARPVTFFVLAKKVTKESRAYEGAPVGCPVLLGAARGPANSLPAVAQTGRPLTAPASPALRGAFGGSPTASRCSVLAPRRGGSARGRRCGAGRQRGSAGRVSESVARRRRDRASFAHGPLTPCSARAAEAIAQAGLVRSLFLGDFLWRSKESYRHRAVSGRSTQECARARAAASTTHAAHLAIPTSC